jgi:hypothetical protein
MLWEVHRYRSRWVAKIQAAAATAADIRGRTNGWWVGSQRRKIALAVRRASRVRPHAMTVRSGWSPGSVCRDIS